MILIKNGLLIDPAAGLDGEYDLLVKDGLIARVEKHGQLSTPIGAKVIDAAGRWVLPGLVDLHVHLRDPGQHWKETVETGSRAALVGGYTHICCMPNTIPVNDSAEITRYIIKKAQALKGAKVYPIGAITLGQQGKDLAPLSELFKSGCVAFSDDGHPVSSANVMRRALEWSTMLPAPLACHEEDLSLAAGGVMNEGPLSERLGLRGMPTVAEDVMVARDIELARFTGGRVHICHISSERGVELVRRAKADGIPVTAEVTPHHLFLEENCVSSYDANFKMSPPLRDSTTIKALRAGLADGTLDAIASDHAPHEIDVKQVEFDAAAMGVLGLQTNLPLALELIATGVVTRTRAIAALTSSPAAAFNLRAGTLVTGSPADVTIVDPDRKWSFGPDVNQSKSCNSPFVGRELTGAADTVLVDGRVVFADGVLVV